MCVLDGRRIKVNLLPKRAFGLRTATLLANRAGAGANIVEISLPNLLKPDQHVWPDLEVYCSGVLKFGGVGGRSGDMPKLFTAFAHEALVG